MDLLAPEKQSDQSYIVPISIESNIRFSYSSRESGKHATPPETHEAFKTFLHTLASAYEIYSRDWFSNPIIELQFLKRLTHDWNFGKHLPNSQPDSAYIVHQIWCPEKLHVYPRSIKIHWNLVDLVYGDEHPPGFKNTVVDPDTFPLTEAEAVTVNPSEMERALRKVREARLQAAVTAAYAKKLALRYYERYGTMEISQPDSILSSSEDEESAAVPPKP